MNCPLCSSQQCSSVSKDNYREYFRCSTCKLIFADPQHYISIAEEKAIYDQHENDPLDANYRKFLSTLFDPIQQRLESNLNGLDFGSGPGPTLSKMFEEQGHLMNIYDLFYHNDKTVFEDDYDFIVTSETVEHLHFPLLELDRLWRCLKLNGILGVMTKQYTNTTMFENWYYKKDLTHVIFFHESTFQWLSEYWQSEVNVLNQDVAIFTKTKI